MTAKVLLVLFFVLDGGCALFGQAYPSLVRPKRGEIPELGSPAQKSVGEVVYAKFDYTETVGIRLDQPLATKHLARNIALQARAFLWAYQGKKGTDYCAKGPTVAGLWNDNEILCFRDTDRDGRLDQLHIPGTAFGSWAPLKSQQLISYRDDVSLDASKGYRYELLYQGVAENVLRLSYREYVDNFARPAFTQDLTYTLLPSGPTEIVFRGARLRVHGASNEALSYEMLSGLSEP